MARVSNIRVVLVETSHPGNIGAAARAMKTMGLSRLDLVAPREFPSEEARARASGADDVLADALVHGSLEEALRGCGLVMGASARTRSLPWPLIDAREAGVKAAVESDATEVALVFGRERSGLANDELARCHYLVNIPTNPDFYSLNVASAVQVLAYEVMMASETGVEGGTARDKRDPPATAEEMEGFYAHLERVMIATGFLDPAVPRQLMRRMRRLFGRARTEQTEVNILRGLLSAVETGRKDVRPPDSRKS